MLTTWKTMHIENLRQGDSIEIRGQRVKYIRETILGLSRNKFSQRHKDLELTVSTLQNWEDARYGGLTEKGGRKLIEAFAREGVQCSLQWLLFGTGEAPPEARDFNLVIENITAKQAVQILADTGNKSLTDEESIAKELRYFRELHVDAIDAIVSDDGLSPYFEPGDCVAGIRLNGQDIRKAIGLPCIIQTQLGQVLVRKLEAGSQMGYYTLLCTNPHTQVKDIKATEVKLFSAAPIVWLRKPIRI